MAAVKSPSGHLGGGNCQDKAVAREASSAMICPANRGTKQKPRRKGADEGESCGSDRREGSKRKGGGGGRFGKDVSAEVHELFGVVGTRR